MQKRHIKKPRTKRAKFLSSHFLLLLFTVSTRGWGKRLAVPPPPNLHSLLLHTHTSAKETNALSLFPQPQPASKEMARRCRGGPDLELLEPELSQSSGSEAGVNRSPEVFEPHPGLRLNEEQNNNKSGDLQFYAYIFRSTKKYYC